MSRVALQTEMWYRVALQTEMWYRVVLQTDMWYREGMCHGPPSCQFEIIAQAPTQNIKECHQQDRLLASSFINHGPFHSSMVNYNPGGLKGGLPT